MKATKYTTLVIALLISTLSIAQKYTKTETNEVTKKWNEVTFSSSKSFAENMAEASNFSILSKELELKASLNAIENEEMVTVFAMTNTGYEKLNEVQDSIYNISVASNRVALVKYHLIPGRVDSHSIKKAISRNNGITYFSTVQGEKLGIKDENGELYLVDNQGNTSKIVATDFYHKNGFFHIVEGFVLPTTE